MAGASRFTLVKRKNSIMKGRLSMQEYESHHFKAGDALQDLCRACRMVRSHTVIAADPGGAIIRVICDYCGSQHNYRGGEERDRGALRTPAIKCAQPQIPQIPQTPLITDREREFPMVEIATKESGSFDLEMLLRRIIREEIGLTPVSMAEKWRGGEMILKPGRGNLQEKSWPIETFFHKVVMLRNRLRVLEQQINGSDMPEDAKVKLQAYITGCYGTLTSFNILFEEEDDKFHGSAVAD
jgi:hypothetical protein